VIGVFLLLVVLRMPIGFSFATAGLLGVALLRTLGGGISLLGTVPYAESANYILVAIPMFVLMGQFIFNSGLSSELYDACYKWFGRFRGGLALSTVGACTFFAACTGSSMAAVGTIGPTAMHEMKRFNYEPRFAAGSIVSGGTLGILIPPSIAFIVYGYLCAVSIGELFIAGILPGLFIALMLALTIYLLCLRNPKLGPAALPFPWKEMLAAGQKVWWVFLVLGVVLGGIYAGIFTPTEAGAIGAFIVFIILLLMRRMNWKTLVSSLKDSAVTTCMIFTIFIGAKVFNVFIGLSGIPLLVTTWIGGLPLPPLAILVIILIAYVPLGCFIDSLPLFILTLPVIFPVIDLLGINPTWFGVLLVLMAQISLITPPVGMNVYVLAGITDVPMDQIFRGAFPFLIAFLIALAILIAFPQISLFLPGLMM